MMAVDDDEDDDEGEHHNHCGYSGHHSLSGKMFALKNLEVYWN